MSEEETECRLTFEEGRRIRREAEKPYMRKVLLCLILALAFTTGFLLLADIEYDVLWKGGKAIEDRIIAGDFQAIADYFHYRSIRSAGPTAGILFVLCGGRYAILGELAGKKALKEANKEKVERWTRG